MLYRFLSKIGRGGGNDYGQQSEPGIASLIKIADAEETYDMGKECGADRPEVPLLIAIPFHGFSGGPDPGETDVDHGHETDECCQPT